MNRRHDDARLRRPALGLGLMVVAVVTLASGAATAVEPETDPARTFSEGPGLLGGQQYFESVFTIHAVATDGSPRLSGGDPFVVTISPPAARLKMKDNHDGTYSVAYTPESPGTHLIAITLDGEHTRDSPFAVSVKPAPSAENSYAGGPGLDSPIAGQETAFTIYAVDHEGNQRTDGGDSFPIEIRGPGGIVLYQLIDNFDGTYTARYTPPSAGNYTIKVTHRGKNISGSPYHVTVLAL